VFPVSRPYLAFGRRNPDPKLFYILDHACKCFHLEENVCGKWKFEAIALTKQTWRPVVRKIKKKLKKKLKPTYLPKFLQEEIGNAHIFFGLMSFSINFLPSDSLPCSPLVVPRFHTVHSSVEFLISVCYWNVLRLVPVISKQSLKKAPQVQTPSNLSLTSFLQ
jgi:hypothetical protein